MRYTAASRRTSTAMSTNSNPSESVQALLAQAQHDAAPHTRRIARWLAALAVASMVGSAVWQGWNQLMAVVMPIVRAVAHILGVVVTAAEMAVSAVCTLAAGVVHGIAAHMYSTYGLALLAAGIAVTVAWYRAREQVMFKTVDLLLARDLSEQDGKALADSFVRTDHRCSAIFGGIALMGLALMLDGQLVHAVPCLSIPFLLLSFVSFGLCGTLNGLSRGRIATLALFKLSQLDPLVFSRRIKAAPTCGNPFMREMAVLANKGLLGRKPFEPKDLLLTAKSVGHTTFARHFTA